MSYPCLLSRGSVCDSVEAEQTEAPKQKLEFTPYLVTFTTKLQFCHKGGEEVRVMVGLSKRLAKEWKSV